MSEVLLTFSNGEEMELDEYLKKIMEGEIKLLSCSGHSLRPHSSTKINLEIFGSFYQFVCPVCGYGTQEPIPEKYREKLKPYRVKTKEINHGFLEKVKENGFQS